MFTYWSGVRFQSYIINKTDLKRVLYTLFILLVITVLGKLILFIAAFIMNPFSASVLVQPRSTEQLYWGSCVLQLILCSTAPQFTVTNQCVSQLARQCSPQSPANLCVLRSVMELWAGLRAAGDDGRAADSSRLRWCVSQPPSKWRATSPGPEIIS